MELRQLETFNAVARHGSFTRAAQALGYVQSSVTAQIQALEAEFGQVLLDRLGKRVVPTAAGYQLLGYAEQLLRLAEETRHQVSQAHVGQGTVTISAPESLCIYRLPALLRAARTEGLRVVFRPASVPDLPRMVRDGELDVALVFSDVPTGARVLVEGLALERIALIAAPGHPFAAQPSVAPAALSEVTMLLTEPGCAYRVRFERALAEHGVLPHDTLEFSSVEAIKQCVIGEMGLAVLPQIAVARELAAGQLLALPWAGPPLDVWTQLIYHRERIHSTALQAFIRLARATISQG